MINFTIGPVQSPDIVKEIGSLDVPYFRTPEFSKVLLESESLIKKFADAEKEARVVFITGSGTASMEAVVMNTLTDMDKVLIVNGGSFGERFVKICEIHEIPFTEIKLDYGKPLTNEILNQYDGQDYTGFLVNIHETSTGVKYDLDLISQFCERNKLFLIVDAISSFLADDLNMRRSNIDAMIIGSQKALACPPGVSMIVLSKAAVERIQNNSVKSLYFDLKDALKNGERGQTTYTPAVGTILQIHARLKEIDENGGVQEEQRRIELLADNFREGIQDLPLDIFSESLSNAITPLATRNCSAIDIFTILKDEYSIWVCPNGGDLKDKVFRVGHIGNLTIEDNQILLDALHDLARKNILK